MLSSIIIKLKLTIGRISKQQDIHYPFWYVSVHVKANILWKLLVSSVEDVRTLLTFIRKDNSEVICQQYESTWVSEIDHSLIKLSIRTKRKLKIAESKGNNLMPITEKTSEPLVGNQDILLELRSNDNILGQWVFKEAIIQGTMQEANPSKIKIRSSELNR